MYLYVCTRVNACTRVRVCVCVYLCTLYYITLTFMIIIRLVMQFQQYRVYAQLFTHIRFRRVASPFAHPFKCNIIYINLCQDNEDAHRCICA